MISLIGEIDLDMVLISYKNSILLKNKLQANNLVQTNKKHTKKFMLESSKTSKINSFNLMKIQNQTFYPLH